MKFICVCSRNTDERTFSIIELARSNPDGAVCTRARRRAMVAREYAVCRYDIVDGAEESRTNTNGSCGIFLLADMMFETKNGSCNVCFTDLHM